MAPLGLQLSLVAAGLCGAATAFVVPPIVAPRLSTTSTSRVVLKAVAVGSNSSMPGVLPRGLNHRQCEPTDLKECPGPVRWPLVGNMLSMMKSGGFDRYGMKMLKRYGRVVKANLLGVDFIMVADPDLNRDMYTTKLKEFEDRFLAPSIKAVFGEKGIIFSNGHEAATNRRLSSPAFHRIEVLENAMLVVADQAKQLVQRYLRMPQGSVVDIHNDMRGLTLEIVALACFSLPMGFTDPTNAPYPELAGLVRNGFHEMSRAMRWPFQAGENAKRNPYIAPMKRSWAAQAQIQTQIIEARRESRAKARAEGQEVVAKDLLDVYLEAIEQEGEVISNDSILKNVHDLLLAGGDTTAATIAATMFELARRPDVLSRAMDELKDFDINEPQHISPNGLMERLPYINWCMKEALRLYPAAVQTLREAKMDTELGGYRIRKGDVVSSQIYQMHHDEELWGPDVNEFKPDRWKQGPPHPQAFMPFGAGPRICLGMRFSILEGLAIVAVLLKSLDLEAVNADRPLRYHYPGTIAFKGGLPLRVNGPRVTA